MTEVEVSVSPRSSHSGILPRQPRLSGVQGQFWIERIGSRRAFGTSSSNDVSTRTPWAYRKTDQLVARHDDPAGPRCDARLGTCAGRGRRRRGECPKAHYDRLTIFASANIWRGLTRTNFIESAAPSPKESETGASTVPKISQLARASSQSGYDDASRDQQSARGGEAQFPHDPPGDRPMAEPA